MSSIETQQARLATARSLPVPIMSIAAAFFCLAMSMLVSEAIGSVTPSTGLLYSSTLIVITLIGLVGLVLTQPGIAGKHVAYLILLLGVFYWFASPALGYALSADRYVGDRYRIHVSRESLAKSCTYIALFLTMSVVTYWLVFPRISSRINSRQLARTPVGLPYILLGLFLCGMIPYLLFTDNLTHIISSLLAGRTEVRPWKSEGPLGNYKSAVYYFCVSGFVAAGGFAGTWGAMMERSEGLRRIYLGIFALTATVMYFDGGTRSWVALAVIPTVLAWFARTLQSRLTIGRVAFLLGLVCAVQMSFEVARAARHRGWSRDNLQHVNLSRRHFDNDFFTDLAIAVELVPREHGYFYTDDLFAFVTHPIPRFVWRNKPVSSILVFYNDRVHKGYFKKKSGNKLPSSIGQFYMSGGTLGVMLLGILAGLISATASGLIRANHMGLCHFGSLMAVWWFLMSRGVYPGWTYPLFFNWIILIVGFRSVRRPAADDI